MINAILILFVLPALVSIGCVYFLFREKEEVEYVELPWTWNGKKRTTINGVCREIKA